MVFGAIPETAAGLVSTQTSTRCPSALVLPVHIEIAVRALKIGVSCDLATCSAEPVAGLRPALRDDLFACLDQAAAMLPAMTDAATHFADRFAQILQWR
jgi:hypothetical protein